MLSSLLLIAFMPPFCAAAATSKTGVIVALVAILLIILLILFVAWKIRRFIEDSEREALNEIMDNNAKPKPYFSAKPDPASAASFSEHK